MKKAYPILEWCRLPRQCENGQLAITINVDDFLTPDLQRGYISGIKGTIRGTGTEHDGRTYVMIFDKILFKESAYIGTILSPISNTIPTQKGSVEFDIPIIPINYFF
jgi:hypothetical protein